MSYHSGSGPGRVHRPGLVMLLALALCSAGTARGDEPAADVGTYHGNADRSGMYVEPTITEAAAARFSTVTDFDGQLGGNVYAQPVAWRPASGTSRIAVANESDVVAAFDATTGAPLWSSTVGTPVDGSTLPCGNINPLGITGTPAIDGGGTLYADAMISQGGTAHHVVVGLSMANGKMRPGFPIDIQAGLKALGMVFDPTIQNQRGALAVVARNLYVPYGGLGGDCDSYHGWVVGIDLVTQKVFGAWQTTAAKGGIWGQSGVATDGKSIFVATGNTASATTWGGGEAIIRLTGNLAFSHLARDYFTPTDWQTLDNDDLDLGGTGPVPIDLPTGQNTQPVLLALGKDGNAYLLNRDNLGGVSKAPVTSAVSSAAIISAAAVYTTGKTVHVAFHGTCSSGSSGLEVLGMSAGNPPQIRKPWCGGYSGKGAPIVTTTDGETDPVVWVLGAGGDNELHAFNGISGKPLVAIGGLTGMQSYQTPLALDGRLYATANGKLYAFGVSGE